MTIFVSGTNPTFNAAQDTSHMSFSAYNNMNINSFIKNLVTGTQIGFMSVPSSVQETLNVVMNQITIQGRSDPVFFYSSSGPRSLTFTLSVFDDLTPNGIVPTANSIRALAYPAYNGYAIEAPKVYIRLGKFLSMFGYTESIMINWQPTPIADQTYQYADITFTLNQTVIIPYSASLVEQGVLTF